MHIAVLQRAIVFAFTPNSAAAERVFSLLTATFGDQQMVTLADIRSSKRPSVPLSRLMKSLTAPTR